MTLKLEDGITIPRNETERAIGNVCVQIANILIEKNRAYGDSAINPVRIFSSADTREQLLVRIDDKLSRIARGGEVGEDVVLDLIGYLVLLRVHGGGAPRRNQANATARVTAEWM